MYPKPPIGSASSNPQWPIALAALGVVFGDIGTSPLYAFRECFNGPHAMGFNPANLVGAASLIVWTLVLVVTIKYLAFILRLDNKGEGGILALAALVRSVKGPAAADVAGLFTLGIFGATLIYADGMLTPAISVLSAVEGLSVGTVGLDHSIVPVTVAILVGLFAIQRFGTGKVGTLFGPVLVIWFTVLGGLGLRAIMGHPQVLLSLSPHAAVGFLIHQWRHALPLLAAVFLAVTGGEALYADLGHFGRRAIRSAWIWLVFPGLVLNYLGQAALLAVRPEAAENPFFMLVGPDWVLPLTILATAAAIIASQALISGAFSLTSQAIQLGCLPRMTVHHTSATEKGQIYIPFVNWALMVACVMLVLAFRSSAALAGAYGIAIALTMTVTSLLQTLHQRVLLMHVETLDSPVAADAERLSVEDLGEGIHAVHLRFGFAETPDVPAAMKAHLPPALKYDQGRTTFFLGRETYAVAKDTRGFDRFRLGLFSVLSRNATPATAYFQLPASRVVELGAQLSV